MKWYAAHGIFYFKLRDSDRQDEFFVYENVYLVYAESPEDALSQSVERARSEQTDDPSLSWNGQPAQLVFGGIRKLIDCSPPTGSSQVDVERVENGMEATYSGFTVKGRASLDALIAGDPVQVVYEE